MTPARNNTVKRCVSFFKVKTTHNNSFKDILLYIHGLVDGAIYTNKLENDGMIFLRGLRDVDGFVFWTVCVLRMSWIPNKSKIWDRTVCGLGLNPNEGVTESTHFLFNPTYNLLALEYNHFWPRIGTLQWHLNERASTHGSWTMDEVDFEPILNKETLEKLSDMGDIRLLSFSVPKSGVEILSRNDSNFFEMVRSAFSFGDTGEVCIQLKAEWRNRTPIMEDPSALKAELERYWFDISEAFTELKVKAVSRSLSKTKTFDLLQDKTKDEITVVKLWTSRDIDSEDMLEKMKESFNRNKDELIRLANWENI